MIASPPPLSKKQLLQDSPSMFQDLVQEKKQIDEIQLFHGKERVLKFYEELPWEEEHLCIFSAESYEKLFPAETYYGTHSLENLQQTKGKILISQTPHPAHQRCLDLCALCPFIEYKVINDGLLKSDTMVFQDLVAIVHLDPNNLHSIQINSPSLIQRYRQMFEQIWDKK